MAQYNLGPLTLTTSIERDMFAVLRQKYFELGKNHQRQFYAHYVSYGSADDLFERLPVDLENVFSETAAMVLHDLAANGIYDVSEKTIRADLEVRVEAVADGFNRVQGRYFDIIGKAAELEAQRQEARENRAQIVGGGFGLEGAARGMALAAVANAAIGLTYGLANLTAKAASDLGDKEKKRQMLQDPATKADISDFLIRIALQGVELVAATVNNGKTLEAVTDEAHERSAAFVENVGAGRVPDNQVQPVLVQALTLDPFNIGAWAEWLDRYGDRDGCIVACAEALGISDVMTHKTKLIAERKAALSWSTPEECRANSVILEQSAEWLGFPFDSERKMIEAKAVRLDRERRTFNGVEYPSLAEAAEASQVHEDKLQRTVAGVVHETLEGANQARALIREQTILASSRVDDAGISSLSRHGGKVMQEGILDVRPVLPDRYGIINVRSDGSARANEMGICMGQLAVYAGILCYLSNGSNPPFPRSGQVRLVCLVQPHPVHWLADRTRLHGAPRHQGGQLLWTRSPLICPPPYP